MTFADHGAVWCDTQIDTVDAEEAADRDTRPGFLSDSPYEEWDRGAQTKAALPVNIKHTLFSDILLLALELVEFCKDNMPYNSLQKREKNLGRCSSET